MNWPYWLTWRHWVYLVRYVGWGFFQRGYRGWADMDAWSYDTYLAETIAPALRHMAKKAHGFPPFILEDRPDLVDEEGEPIHERCVEAWREWLIQKAVWFEWYHAEELNLTPEMNDKQKLAALDLYDSQHRNFQEKVLADFGKHFESLWE